MRKPAMLTMEKIGQMDNRALRDRAEAAFQFALGCTMNRPELQNLYRKIYQCHQGLEQPMRVAIVGTIKAGKSTMMNAILGEKIVATGTVEATFNVNWLKYGESKSLKVHYKDDRPPETKSFAELEALTVRAEANSDSLNYLLSIKYIELSYPSPILEKFNLIDTPGLASYYEKDSENTRNFLQLHGQELTKVTRDEASNADAVLYLFAKSFSESGKNTMAQFQGAVVGQATPINAIGVLTKVDDYWSDDDRPIQKGHQIAQRLQSEYLRGVFYTTLPVCGLLAFGSQTLTSEEFDTLTQLAKMPAERLRSLIKNAKRFSQKEYPEKPEIPPAAKRKLVLDRLGQYGTWLAADLIRSGTSDRELLGRELFQQSGAAELLDLIKSHFGNRAFLIKLSLGLQQIKAACFMEQQRLESSERQIVADIAGEFEKLEVQEHAFHELTVLGNYYQGELSFSEDEVRQLLAVTSENGTSLKARLGLSENATSLEMRRVAQQQIEYWSQRANDYMSADSQTIEAASVIAHSYEQILHQIGQQEDSHV